MSTRTWKQIKWKAIECKNNVEKTYKIGIYEQWGYYIAKAIQKPYNDVKRNKTMKTAPKPRGDKIKFRITKKEYLKLAKNLTDFVETKNRMPNYIIYNGKRIRCRLYVYMFSKILAYFNTHKQLPNYVDIDYKAFYPPEPQPELHDYLTNEGCSGIGQCTPYYCACNSLQQCFYRLTGIHIDEDTIAEWAATTTDGTDHEGINTAVAIFNRKYNKNIKIDWYNFSELSWSKIKEMTQKGAVFAHLLYRNQWGHYEIIQSVGEELTILNSLGDRCGGNSYCGYIEYRSRSEQESYISGISQKSIAYLHY